MSELPICEKCRKQTVCVKVETVWGARNICLETCFPLWGIMIRDLRKRAQDMLIEYHADFFDVPTRNDLPKVPK